MIDIAHRPHCDFRRARLLASTALIGLAPLVLSPATAFAQAFLDDIPGDGVTDPSSDVSWSADDPIWRYPLWPFFHPLATGDVGILTKQDGSAVMVTIDGTVRPGGFEVRSGQYTLRGGEIAASFAGGGEVFFDVRDGLTLQLESALRGHMRITGEGTVYYLADSQNMTGVTVDEGATLRSEGLTRGGMTVDGTAQLDGVHTWTVNVSETGQLSGSGEIQGVVTNRGEARLGGSTSRFENHGVLDVDGTLNVLQLVNHDSAEATVDAGQRLQSERRITNQGDMTIAGEIEITTEGHRLANQDGGRLVLDAATVIGGLINEEGGHVDLAASSEIRGMFRNSGTLDATGDADSSVQVVGGTFTNRGQILTSGAGRLSIIADEIQLQDASDIDGSLIDLVGNVVNSARLVYSGATTLAGTLRNTVSGLAIVSGTLDADGTDVVNHGTMRIAAAADPDPAGRLQNVATLVNSLQLTIEEGASVQAGRLSNRGQGQATIAGSLTGDLENQANATATLDGGTISGGVTNDGTLNGGGTIGGTLVNRGTVGVDGLLEVGGLTNANRVEIGEGDTLRSASNLANDGTIVLSGSLDIAASDPALTNNSGARLEMHGGRLEGSLANESDATLILSGESAIAGNLENRGLINKIPGNARLEVEGGTFRNWGHVTGSGGGRLAILADLIVLEASSIVNSRFVDLIGEVLNAGELDFTSDTTLSGDLSNGEGGLARVAADVDAAGFDVTNDGTFQVLSAGNGNLHSIGQLTNNVSFTIEQNGAVQAEAATNSEGAEMTIAGQLASALENQTGATLVLQGGTIDGPLVNAGQATGTGNVTGDMTNSGSATIGGAVGGTLANSGTVATGGDLSVGGLTNDGGFTVSDGDRLTSGTRIQNNAQLSVEGEVLASITNGADATLGLEGGTIRGNLSNAGSLTGTGAITGSFSNSGSASLGGSAGAVTNSGQLTTNGDLSVASLTNNDRTVISAGDELAAAGGVTNNATLQVQGNLRGDLRNSETGTATLSEGSGIAGNVTNEGTLNGRAAISGSVTNDGTATIGGSAGDVTNSGTLATDGNLDVASLTNSGSTEIGGGERLRSEGDVENSGSIAVAGRLEVTGEGAAITNQDGATIALDGATIIGNLVNAVGGLVNIASSSTVRGDLTNRGDIDMTSDAADVRLRVADGTFTNSGAVGVSGAGSLVIEADNIQLEEGSDIDGGRVDLIGAVTNEGNLTYSEDATLTDDLRNGDTGRTRVSANLDAAGNNIDNSGSFVVNSDDDSTGNLHNVDSLTNSGSFTIANGSSVTAESTENREGGAMTIGGRLNSGLENRAGATVALNGGVIAGDAENAGTLSGSGRIQGALDNSGTVTFDGTLGDVANSGTAALAGSAGQVANSGTLRTGGDLAVAGLTNDGVVRVRAGDRLGSASRVVNNDRMIVWGTLDAALRNQGSLAGGGTISGNVANDGQMEWGGAIGGNLNNSGALRTTGDVSVAGALVNAPAQGGGTASLTVAEGHGLTAAGGLTNSRNGMVTVEGTLVGDVLNRGQYVQTGALEGSLVTHGDAVLGGRITGDLDYAAGGLTIGDDLSIGGDFTLREDLGIAAGNRISAARTIVAEGATLDLAGALEGALLNDGTVNALRDQARVTGALRNNGVLSMAGDGRADSVLQVGGLSGNGDYVLDVDLGRMVADRIEVRGGATQGMINLDFNYVSDEVTAQPGQRVTLLDVDESQGSANDFRYDYDPIERSSERVVFSVDQAEAFGDLELVSQTNPAIGALFGNVALTQSLIGSVVNRPTSPFVTGLAYEDSEKPCGVGAWGRVTGGTATATGATDNGVSNIESEIRATYYGMQVGSDLACFDGRYAGWDMAFGVLGGVNQGDTTQPVYAVDGRNSQALTNNLVSITKADFTQAYGGVYATATNGRFQADLQYRYETTDFSIRNQAIVGAGLGLDDDFTSTANTISGSIGYGIPIGEEGWAVVPTAGFAWSRISTDSITFNDGDRLSFEDSERQIGFVGATVARTFVEPARNEALYAFATGTYYKDFADPTVSIFSPGPNNPDFESQRLVSDNLGAYGEISIGANYIKVLSETGRGRQFSTSARIDARFGDGLDSVGVTGQLRWQF